MRRYRATRYWRFFLWGGLLVWRCLLPSLPGLSAAPPLATYTDHVYRYTFQFPADWKILPPPAAAGEVRMILQSPAQSTVMVCVSALGRPLTKETFRTSAQQERYVDALIESTLEQVYKKTSREMEATSMVVSEKRAHPSARGIRFAITTVHALANDRPVIVAGIHTLPYAQAYLVSLVMRTSLHTDATEEQQTLHTIWQSFTFLGEKPLASPFENP